MNTGILLCRLHQQLRTLLFIFVQKMLAAVECGIRFMDATVATHTRAHTHTPVRMHTHSHIHARIYTYTIHTHHTRTHARITQNTIKFWWNKTLVKEQLQKYW